MARLNAKWLNFWERGQSWYHFWQDAKASGGSTAYSLSGSSGSYAVTGQSATLALARNLPGAAGSYAVSGKAAALGLARKLSGAYGAYALNGQAATLSYSPGHVAYSLSGSAGAYSLSGQSALLHYQPGSIAPTPDTHDGAEKRNRAFRRAQERRRQDIARAIAALMDRSDEPQVEEIRQRFTVGPALAPRIDLVALSADLERSQWLLDRYHALLREDEELVMLGVI